MASCPNDDPQNRRWGNIGLYNVNPPKPYNSQMLGRSNGPKCTYELTSLACIGDNVTPSGGVPVPMWEKGPQIDSGETCTVGVSSFPFITTQPSFYTNCYRNRDSYPIDVQSRLTCCNTSDQNELIECEPGYCPSSAACESFMHARCTDKFTDDALCKNWCASHSGECDGGARDFCANRAKKTTPSTLISVHA